MARTTPKSHDTRSNGPHVEKAQGSPPVRSRPTAEQIAHRAYELYEARGRVDGLAERDWLQAERELMLGRQ